MKWPTRSQTFVLLWFALFSFIAQFIPELYDRLGLPQQYESVVFFIGLALGIFGELFLLRTAISDKESQLLLDRRELLKGVITSGLSLLLFLLGEPDKKKAYIYIHNKTTKDLTPEYRSSSVESPDARMIFKEHELPVGYALFQKGGFTVDFGKPSRKGFNISGEKLHQILSTGTKSALFVPMKNPQNPDATNIAVLAISTSDPLYGQKFETAWRVKLVDKFAQYFSGLISDYSSL